MRRGDDRFRRQVVADILAGQAAGAIRPDVEPRTTAVALIGELRGTALQRLVDPDAVTWTAVQIGVVERWRYLLSPDRSV